MAVFFTNTCRFGRCSASFQSLRDLILHIEETHIDFDPNIIEKFESQQPSSLPLSYVLRVSKESSKKLNESKKGMRAHSPVSSVCSTGNTPTGSEMEDDFLTESEESCDSWVSKDEFSSEYVLRMLSAAETTTESRPFACPVPGCKKRYKNISGIRCHAKKGHNRDIKLVKCYKCHCGKSYKTSQGLRSHTSTHHCHQEAAVKSKIDNFVSVLQGVARKSATSNFIPLSIAATALKDKLKASAGNSEHATVPNGISADEVKLAGPTAFGAKPPPLSPILQQHLLSPVVPKKVVSVKSELNCIPPDHLYP